LPLIQQLKTIPLYIQYFFSVVDEHSIQAPLAFQIFNELKKGRKEARSNDEIEQYRRVFQKDHAQITDDDMGAGSMVSKVNTISSIAKYGISSEKDCLFLRKMAELCEAKICLELGTSLGIATSYLANAKNVDLVYTFEGKMQLVKKARQLFDDLHIKKIQIVEGDIDDELPAALDHIDHVDLAIIDANHQKKALLAYFNLLKAKVSSHGVIIIDDIRWSTDMYQGWLKLVKSNDVSLSMDFLNKGVLFFEKGIQKQHYILWH